jgi:tetraacyldisaccharide 4'-kinase
MDVASRLTRAWYAPRATALANTLRPLSWLFGAVAASRRAAYRNGWLRRVRLRVPVVVVGNLTAGGAGKTPLVIALVAALRARGRRPGIVSRGHGRRTRDTRAVRIDDDPDDAGDEPLLLAASGVPVFVGADRPAAAQALLAAHPEVDVIVADDGLQHLRLARDVEIAVVNGARGLGNRCMLPAGPLREPPSRLDSVNGLVVTQRGAAGTPPMAVHGPVQVLARLRLGDAISLATGERRALTDFVATHELHAVAGVGHPEAFFAGLRAAGLAPATHALADHRSLEPERLPFPAGATVLMTEKDAVKCAHFAQPRWWWVELQVQVDRDDATLLLGCVLERTGLTGAGAGLG